MKILYVAGVNKYGTYILSRDIFTVWIKHGYDIVFVHPNPEGPMVEFAHKYHIPVYYLALFKIYRIDEVLKLAIIARREKVDVIHACNLPQGRFICRIASFLANTRLVLYIGTEARAFNNSLIRLLQKLLHRWVIKTADGLISMTNHLVNQLRAELNIPENMEIAVIPHGVDLSLIKKKNPLEYMPNSKGDFAIRAVQVARLAPEKGQDIVLRAIAYVLQKGYRISVDFIGDESYPGYEAYLYKLIVELGLPADTSRFLGYHPAAQVYQELAKYDLFLHPSRSEGQGIAVLEAMAAGLPVVASQAGGLKELVVQKVTGLLVPVEDSKALAGAIIWLIQAPARRVSLGEAGYLRAKEKFSLELTESKLIKFYEHLAKFS